MDQQLHPITTQEELMRPGKLIAISYAGGAGGNALAYALSMSPELLQAWHNDDISQCLTNEGAIDIPTRLLEDVRSTRPWDIISVHEYLGKSIYDPWSPLPDDVIAAYDVQRISFAVDVPTRPRLLDALQHTSVVIADHTISSHQRLLHPDATIVAIWADWKLNLRHISTKWLLTMQPEHDGYTTIDYELIRTGSMIDRMARKRRLHSQLHNIRCHQVHMSASDYVVRFEDLFNSESWMREYNKLVNRLGLTAQPATFAPWLQQYLRLQWKRQ